jgi:hypothetical protein
MANHKKRTEWGITWQPHPSGKQRTPDGTRGEWWISYMCARGHRHREKIGPKSLARQEHTKRRYRIKTEGYCPQQAAQERLTVADLLALVVADYKANGRRALGEVQRHEKRLAAHFGPKRDAADLTTGDIDAYAALRRKSGAAVATVNPDPKIARA